MANPKINRMKKIYSFLFLIFFFVQADAQTFATTTDGRRVILYANGNWRYADRNNRVPGSTDLSGLYNDAYKYAYEVVYADEFFSTERSKKAALYAGEYVAKNIYIPIGSRTLEQWYNDLYSFANNNLYKEIIFSPDRKKAANSWVEQVLKDKAFFEDFKLSIIDRHRMAYDVAYKYIYEQEFFATDRRKIALQWANDFVKR